jgi:drug/metabolite transporter (DMT)-like permease
MRVSIAVTITAVVVAFCNAEVATVSSVGKINSGLKKHVKSSKVVDFQAKVECVASGPTIINAAPALAQLQSLKMVGLFVLWYGFNAGYNVYNAYVKKDFQYPFAIATLQLLIGMLYAVPLWLTGVRKMPIINKEDFLRLLPIAMLNAAGHACAVNAMFEKGGGSFTHVIKASEPVVSVILGLIVNGIKPKPFTAVSLLPITYGVAYASTLGQLDVKTMSRELTTKAAKMAMGSNVAFALRSILRKDLPKDFKGRTNLDPANEHAVTTAISVFLTLPFVFYFESFPAFQKTFSAMVDKPAFLFNLGFYYLCGYFPLLMPYWLFYVSHVMRIDFF